ncbi:Uncharacterized glycosyltransferase YcjM [Olavius algarvensis associated proteobacterium Delta 3]|nr:Uncharacterized glycosyltransferase YcjM [Olavius algarvensis associated proteobacterium Delta 3]
MDQRNEVRDLLVQIYGDRDGRLAAERIFPLLDAFPKNPVSDKARAFFSESDVIVITYGDSIRQSGEMPLATLKRFADTYFKDVFSAIHILPFYPYSSDDGFSVTDFYRVDPEIGTWRGVSELKENFRLMFDYVLNHISAQSDWFRHYLAGTPGYSRLAIEVDPATDLSMVVRPRALPLLTEFRKAPGQTVHVWTTFSADQIDLNYKSLDVLERMVRVLLFYLGQGASMLRLDAVAYLWKELGTTCIHLEKTHTVVKLFRAILDIAAPGVILVSETNVPHHENISYFGNGRDEAQMVYNFTLPPLLLHTFLTRNASELTRWAAGLDPLTNTTIFLNFTASHDGIGVRPLEGILPDDALDRLAAHVVENGGLISHKRNPDGSESPYELNITYVDALLDDAMPAGDAFHAERFLASQTAQLSMPGMPGIYIHSILGSRNWSAGVASTGRARTINREKLMVSDIIADLEDPASLRHQIFYPYTHRIRVRRRQPAFHPSAHCRVLALDPRVFALVRSCPDQTIYALTNVTPENVDLAWPELATSGRMGDLISGREQGTAPIRLNPYQSVWLTSG